MKELYEIEGNFWSSDLYTYEEALEEAKTMVNCKGCIDSRECKNCVDCLNCTKCENCENCTNCVECETCQYCTNCFRCSYCTECFECDTCYNAHRSFYSKNIKNKAYIYRNMEIAEQCDFKIDDDFDDFDD